MGNNNSGKNQSDTNKDKSTSQYALDYKRNFDITAEKGDGIVFGYHEASKKTRDEDQATYVCWKHSKDGTIHGWGIFDGHGGYECALYSSQHFLQFVKESHKNAPTGSDWKQILSDAFSQFDQHLGTLHIRGGCTVLCVFYVVSKKQFIVANVGDARAIHTTNNGTTVCPLSFDHTPVNEYDRIATQARQLLETQAESPLAK
ncbi:hypothetical protein RFI_21293 [Reticulomyxa filosa]|uniref:PPM-type phosphatase domain-containing protein n=1 Tax=Reticulomyxa filosa TaxID=46433 RepID=X6MRJ2_RETFI|nr:hypothetical protein RFI_21293 [Reticulomyxa filosa]|eukprot:ETO16067.1 hypothetical protein RFI_21293 [Reticulomyxa filosa]